jgi:hypothetical protein
MILRLTILLIIIIIITFLILIKNKNNKENFQIGAGIGSLFNSIASELSGISNIGESVTTSITEPDNSTIKLDDTVFNTKHNIFVGYSEDQAKELKSQLKKIDEFDIDGSNLILSSNEDRNFTDFSINNLKITESDTSSLQNKINYKKQELDENGLPMETSILYNHKDQMQGKKPPNKLCIDDVCIDKKKLAMINGNSTIKIQHHDNSSESLIPIYTYSGGKGNARYGNSQDETDEDKPFEFYFYQWNNLISDASNAETIEGNRGYLPTSLDNDYNIHDTKFKYKSFKYFALYNQYKGGYLRTINGSYNVVEPELTYESIFEFDGFWNGTHSKIIFDLFVDNNSEISLPLGLKNVRYNKWLAQERGSYRRRCQNWANQNRPWFLSWEHMHVRRIIPPSQGNDPLSVYIVSNNCWRGLSAWTGLPFCHFSSNFSLDDPSIYGHNMWRIVPIANKCSEKCKADFNTSTSCEAPLCNAPIENNVPKSLQCPIDRPVCRYYNGKHGKHGTWLGHCSKELLSGSIGEINNEVIVNDFRFAKPDQRIYKTDYSVNENIDEEEKNKDFYSEYTLKLARNNNGKLYKPDTYKHFHSHTQSST